MTDRDLLQAYANGSDEAFGRIVDRYTDMVYACCLRILGDPHAAEDAAQATFLVLARKAGRLGEKTVLAAWLFRTAQYAARNAQRKAAVRRRHEQEASMERSQRTDGAPSAALSAHLDAAFGRLSGTQQDAVVLRYVRGLTVEEAAAEAGVPSETLHTRARRALEKMRTALRRRGVVLPAAGLGASILAESAQAAPAGLAASIRTACAAKTAASSTAISIAQGVTRMMWMAKIKAAACAVAGVLAVGATATVLMANGWAAEETGYSGAYGERTAAADISFSLDNPGQVSLAVYGQDGTLLRTLLTGQKLPAGAHEIRWDGLDRWGRPAQPGTYEWRMLRTPGFRAEYLLSVGNRRPDDRNYIEWVGNHGPLHSVACNGTYVYIGGMGENVPGAGLFTLDDTEVKWLQVNGMAWGTTVDAAFVEIAGDDGPQEFLLRHITNRETSELRLYRLDGHEHGRSFSIFYDQKKRKGKGSVASNGKHVVVVYPDFGTMRCYDIQVFRRDRKESAAPMAEREIPVDKPAGVALAESGMVYLFSEGAVKTVDTKGEIAVLIPAERLDEPHALAYQRETGDLLIAEWGETFQVRRYDAATGERKAAYGRKGGRAYGAYEPGDLRHVRDLAGDGRGGFVVIEGGGSVRRIAHFNAKGRFVREWPSGQPFYNLADFDPADPARVIYSPDKRVKAVAQCDVEAGTWTITHEFLHNDFGASFMPAPSHYNVRWRAIRGTDGELYLWSEKGGGVIAVLRVDFATGRLAPVTAAGKAPRRIKDKGKWRAERPLGRAYAAKDLAVEDAPFFTWSDADGEGDVDAEECSIGSLPGGGSYALTSHVDDAFRLVFTNFGDKEKPAVGVLFENAAAAGAPPAWDLDHYRVLHVAPHPEQDEWGMGTTTGIWRTEEGALYRIAEANGHGQDRSANGWPTLGRGTHRFFKIRPDGSPAWIVGRHAMQAPNNLRTPHPPGHFHNDTRIIGRVHGTVVVADRVVTPAAAWTEDGLYAGSFFDRRADDGLPGRIYHWWRDPATSADGPVPYDLKMSGSVHALPDPAEGALWAPMGEQNSPIYRVTGFTGWDRQNGTFTLSKAPLHAGRDGTGLRAQYFDNAALEGEPVATQVDPRLWFDNQRRARPHGAWSKKGKGLPGGLDRKAPFSVRWTGSLVPQFSEPYTFYVFNRHIPSATKSISWNDAYGGVRVYLGGRCIIDNWLDGGRERHRPRSAPILLEAGRQYDLRVEYVYRAPEAFPPECNLVWESETQEGQRVPTAYLYPERPDVPVVALHAEGALAEADAAKTARFRVTVDRPLERELTVWLERQKGAEAHPVRPRVPFLRIPAGETSSGPVALNAVDDERINPCAQFGYALVPHPDYRIDASRAEATVPFADDEYGPSDGLLVHLTFDRHKAARFFNYAGRRKTASLSRAYVPQLVDDSVSGKAIYFDKLRPKVTALSISAKKPRRPYTMACWIKTTSPTVGVAWMWRHAKYLAVVYVDEGKAGFCHGFGASAVPDATVSDGRWHHLAATVFEDGKIRLIVDGAHAAKGRGSKRTMRPDARFQIGPGLTMLGRRRPEGMAPPLWVDEVRLYDRALSEQEIARLATRPGE